MVALPTKCAVVTFISIRFSFESKDLSCDMILKWPFCQLYHERSGKQVLHTHMKAAQISTKDQVPWLHLRPCLVPSWCGASKTMWDCLKPWGVSSPRAEHRKTQFENEWNAYTWINAKWKTRSGENYTGKTSQDQSCLSQCVRYFLAIDEV